MAKILINDGIHPTGERLLKEAGHELHMTHIPMEELPNRLNEFDAVCVRSATKIRKELIDQSSNLKLICRGGVGMDNIDVQYARDKGIAVHNTPAASTRSVAELAMTHMLNLARGIHLSNRTMPAKGHDSFKALKKDYSKGVELEGKTLAIIGFGRIGQELASIGLGLGMDIIPVDRTGGRNYEVGVGPKHLGFKASLTSSALQDALPKADFISLNVPSTDKPMIGKDELEQIKEGAILINTARGGSIDEQALKAAIESGKIKGAGLDVFVNEPKPNAEILGIDSLSLSPHIGASTKEAQEKIGIELATIINSFFSA